MGLLDFVEVGFSSQMTFQLPSKIIFPDRYVNDTDKYLQLSHNVKLRQYKHTHQATFSFCQQYPRTRLQSI